MIFGRSSCDSSRNGICRCRQGRWVSMRPRGAGWRGGSGAPLLHWGPWDRVRVGFLFSASAHSVGLLIAFNYIGNDEVAIMKPPSDNHYEQVGWVADRVSSPPRNVHHVDAYSRAAFREWVLLTQGRIEESELHQRRECKPRHTPGILRSVPRARWCASLDVIKQGSLGGIAHYVGFW